jgi:uncharacterized membrane protein
MTISAQTPINTASICVKKLENNAHWQWMRTGFDTLRLSFLPSFGIGFAIVVLSWVVVWFLHAINFGTLVPAAVGGFIFIAPLLATSIYNLARAAEEKGEIKDFPPIKMQPYSKSQLGYIGFGLFFIIITWAIFTHVIWSVAVGLGKSVDESHFINFIFQTPQGLSVLVFGGGIGLVLGLFCFCIAAISLPLVFDKDIDALSAMAISFKAVFKNPIPMLSWAFVILLCVIISGLFGFVPFIIAFPWLGHATWRLYRLILE